MTQKEKHLSILFAFFAIAFSISAEIRLGSPFQDHMVLQRDKPVAIWGWADKGEKVTVNINNQSASATTDENGKWMVYIPQMKYGGPYTLKAVGKNTITLNDIYIGEVWICSGQSNMVMTVAKEDRYWCGVYNEEQEVAKANYPLIRMYTVDFNTSDIPSDTCTGLWEAVSPQTVGHMSAAAYFFARDIYEKHKIPIGLLVTAYGASTVETWTSEEAMKNNDRIKPLLEKYTAACEDYDSGHAYGRYTVQLEKWEKENGVTSTSDATDSARSQDVDAKPTTRKPSKPKNPHKDQHSPYVCWNAMVNPLVPYTLRGAIWYQGESNGVTANIYREQMEVMIKDWREKWALGDFPFYYVQLANRGNLEDTPANGGADALVREAQLQNLWLRNTGMVVAIDNANPEKPTDVHPKNKQEIGRRFALIARANVYGENKLVYSGPIYKSMDINGNKVKIEFDHVGSGLVAKNGKLDGFAIAGKDGKFVWANGKIDGNTIILWSNEIEHPTTINYGFGRNPITSLYNKEGLPASPFRTNDK